jgi:hypothetical protein
LTLFLSLTQSCLTGFDDGLAAAGNLQFAEDIGHLIADRFGAQAEPFSDGGIGQSLRQELQDFSFARRKIRKRQFGCVLDAAPKKRNHLPGDTRAEDHFAIYNRPYSPLTTECFSCNM